MTQYNQSYLYMLLDPRVLPMSPFYIGIGHQIFINEKEMFKKYPRPFNGHFLFKSITYIKRKNKNNSFKLNKIVKIKEQGLEVKVFIVHENISSKRAKELEKYYIKRFGRKGIDTFGTLTNVFPGGDGHDKKSAIYCRKKFKQSKEWAKSWMKDEEKVKNWKKHLSISSLISEKETHSRAKNMKKVSKKLWENKVFIKNHSEQLSKRNKKNWNNPEYRKNMCEKLKKAANKDEKKQISSNNLKNTVKYLWKNSESFRKEVSEHTRKKALLNNSNEIVKKRQQLFRLISMYFNKHKKYPWNDSSFNIKKNKTILPKLLNIFNGDKEWLKIRINKINQDIKDLENFLKREGFLK